MSEYAFALREEFQHKMRLHDSVAFMDGQGERKSLPSKDDSKLPKDEARVDNSSKASNAFRPRSRARQNSVVTNRMAPIIPSPRCGNF